jgi:hypothetical protein
MVMVYDFKNRCGRRFGDVERSFIRNGVHGTFKKNKDVTLLGWSNQIKVVGYVRCDNSNDTDKAMEILKECGYNYCKKKSEYCIEVMYDTSEDDWGIKI